MQRYGHDLVRVLAEPARIAEVAEVLEPGKRALAVRIATQLFAAMAEKSAADQVKLAEANFLVMLEKAGLREPRVAKQLWRFCSGADCLGIRGVPFWLPRQAAGLADRCTSAAGLRV